MDSIRSESPRRYNKEQCLARVEDAMDENVVEISPAL